MRSCTQIRDKDYNSDEGITYEGGGGERMREEEGMEESRNGKAKRQRGIKRKEWKERQREQGMRQRRE